MSVLNPDHLFEQADRLIAPVGGGAPRQADLRRAISAAYYGVFHAIVSEAADDLVGTTQRQSSRYALVYRSIDHSSLRKLCEDVAKPKLPQRYTKFTPSSGFGPNLKAAAVALVDLQEKRHLADYDPLFRVRASDATLAVVTARTAVERFRKVSRARRRAFLSLLVFAPR